MILRGRAVSSGRAEGRSLVTEKPMSFLGGVDQKTGIVTDPASDLRGMRIAGRVLAFPHGKGSTVGSYVIYGLARRGRGPAAIVNERTEAIVATGAILGGTPLVDGVEVSLLRTGDRTIVDGDAGVVALPDVTERPVVTAFLGNRGRILVVKRGSRVKTFRGAWSGISGYLEGLEPPLWRARREVLEETGIEEARLVARGPVFRTRHESTVFAIHPFLFDVQGRRVTEVEGTGEFPDTLRQSFDDFKDQQYPHLPGPGANWISTFALCTNPKYRRSPSYDTAKGSAKVHAWCLGHRRSGFLHASVGAAQVGEFHKVIRHFDMMYTNLTADGRPVIQDGHLVALDDPYVRSVAERFGNPDELLSEDWIPDPVTAI